MAKPAARIAAIQFGFALGILAVLARAAQLQIVEAERWARRGRAASGPRRSCCRPGAARSTTGTACRSRSPRSSTTSAWRRTSSTTSARRSWLLVRNLGVSAPALNREFQARQALDLLHGPFTATQVQPLRQVNGIHLTGEFQRFYPSRDLARPIIGGLAPDRPVGGSGLEARAGLAPHRRAGRGGAAQGSRGPPLRLARPEDARPGRRATTSSSRSTRSCRRSPSAGWTTRIAQMQAEGGDVVFLDPNIGRAAGARLPAGRRAAARRAPRRSPIRSSPARPPSSSPRRRCCCAAGCKPTDAVSGENGGWIMPVTSSGRTRRITDAHAQRGTLTLARAIQVSSNIAMAKFSSRLRPEEQFETLRDFGFGTPTGAEFPGESRGILALPRSLAADVHPRQHGDGLRVRR